MESDPAPSGGPASSRSTAGRLQLPLPTEHPPASLSSASLASLVSAASSMCLAPLASPDVETEWSQEADTAATPRHGGGCLPCRVVADAAHALFGNPGRCGRRHPRPAQPAQPARTPAATAWSCCLRLGRQPRSFLRLLRGAPPPPPPPPCRVSRVRDRPAMPLPPPSAPSPPSSPISPQPETRSPSPPTSPSISPSSVWGPTRGRGHAQFAELWRKVIAESIVYVMAAYHAKRQLLQRYEAAQQLLAQQTPPAPRQQQSRPAGARSPPPAYQRHSPRSARSPLSLTDPVEVGILDANDNELIAPDMEVIAWLDCIRDSFADLDRRIAECREALIAGRMAIEAGRRAAQGAGEGRTRPRRPRRPASASF